MPDSVGTAERREACDTVVRGDAEYLFLSPELLANEEVVARLEWLGVGLFVVDEGAGLPAPAGLPLASDG